MLNGEDLAIREVRMQVSEGRICKRRGREVGDAELKRRWDIVNLCNQKSKVVSPIDPLRFLRDIRHAVEV